MMNLLVSGLALAAAVTAKPAGTKTAPTGVAKAAAADPPSPTQSGLTSDCTKFYQAKSGDSCYVIANSFGTFEVDDFLKWNPAVGSDCTALFVDYYYCVGVPGTPSEPSEPTGPSPTQSGIISSCEKYYKVKSGDSCQAIVDSYGTFDLSDFIDWNPAVGSKCSSLFLGYYYCVGIPGTPSEPPPPTGCQSSHPTPTQPGSICKCKKWHKVVSGDTCDRIEKQFGVSASNFNKWNSGVGKDCSGLFLDYNVCVSA